MPGDGDTGELNRSASFSFGVSGGDRGEKKLGTHWLWDAEVREMPKWNPK